MLQDTLLKLLLWFTAMMKITELNGKIKQNVQMYITDVRKNVQI